MSEKLAILITALAVCGLLTLEPKGEEIMPVEPVAVEPVKPVVEKTDFYSKDFLSDSSVSGSWTGKDQYKIKEFEGSGNINIILDNSNKPELGKTYKFQTCCRNASRPAYNRTCKPRNLGFMTRAWIAGQRSTLTMVNWAWNVGTMTRNAVLNAVVSMADEFYSGVMFVADWTCDRLTWLVEGTWDKVMRMTERTWDIMTWLAEGTWDRVMRMTEWAWDIVTWLAEGICYEVSWQAYGIWNAGVLFVNAVATFGDHLQSHVKYVLKFFVALTSKDFFTVCVANFFLLSVCLMVKFTMNTIQRKRQARQDKEAAESTASRQKPIWRPKQKKKRRKNNKDW